MDGRARHRWHLDVSRSRNGQPHDRGQGQGSVRDAHRQPGERSSPGLIDGKVVDVDLSDIKREFILWMHETTFWGQELNHIVKGDKEIPLWTNPTVGARLGEKIRFHIIGIGTAFHTFHLHGHRWIEPGTTSVAGEPPGLPSK